MGTKTNMAPEINAQTPFDPKKADVFALGVVLFQLVAGDFPFQRAVETDPVYGPVKNNDFITFWESVEKKVGRDSLELEESLKSLLEGMLAFYPENRLSMREVMNHPWYAGAVASEEQLLEELGVS